jgi:hypothetical protein
MTKEAYELRLKRITEYVNSSENLASTQTVSQWLYLDEQPAKYLAVEYNGGDVLWAVNQDTLDMLARDLDESETRRDAIKVFDLDTNERIYVIEGITEFRSRDAGLLWKRS